MDRLPYRRASALLAGALLSLSACALPPALPAGIGHVTLTELGSDGFTIQDPVAVEVTCTYLFGWRVGPWRLPGYAFDDPALHSRAADALHERSGGRPLVHVTRDLTVTSYLGLINVYRLTITADTVTFLR